jgi:Tfp pilus assembly pilus retraction ATPase PilT
MNSKELLNSILQFATQENYPDIHINSNEKVKIRDKSGNIEDLVSININ